MSDFKTSRSRQHKARRWLGQYGVMILLWLMTLGLIFFFSDKRYITYTNASSPGVDFQVFIQAARNVAHGFSPYGVHKYVYAPILVLLMAPFSSNSLTVLWHYWTIIIILFAVLSTVIFTLSQRRLLAGWRLPLLLIFATFTILYIHYFPMSEELFRGQTDTLALPLLILAAMSVKKESSIGSAIWVGGAYLLKLWPAVFGIVFVSRWFKNRRNAIIVLIGIMCIAPLLILALWGGSGLYELLRNLYEQRNQLVISDSVWEMPRLLFSHTGEARPLLASFSLEVFATIVLFCWVARLLIITLYTKGDQMLALFNIAACIILLMPLSHRQYAILMLPILWFWFSRVISGDLSRRTILVVVALLIWWLCLNVSWPYSGSPYNLAAIKFSVPFFADLMAVSASVIGESKGRLPSFRSLLSTHFWFKRRSVV